MGDSVLYHSLFESASPQWILSASVHPSKAVGLVNTWRLAWTYLPERSLDRVQRVEGRLALIGCLAFN